LSKIYAHTPENNGVQTCPGNREKSSSWAEFYGRLAWNCGLDKAFDLRKEIVWPEIFRLHGFRSTISVRQATIPETT
jgi:hypothetical protein